MTNVLPARNFPPIGEINAMPDTAKTFSSRLHLSRLVLTDFRNYSRAELKTGPAPVVLFGENGAGKTNILEAISLFVPGRGLRRAAFSDLSRQSAAGQWGLAASLSGPDGSFEVGTGLSSTHDAGMRREVRIDGDTVSGSGALGNYFKIIWLTPSMDRLFTGPASERRRFLDRLVSAIDRGHAQRVTSFEKSMRERNRLLEVLNPDAKWLEAIEMQMAEAAVAIAAARREAIICLEAFNSDNHHNAVAEFPQAGLVLEGELEKQLNENPAVKVEDNYRIILADSRETDARAGRTLRGPHRTDLIVHHKPSGMLAALCSTGEQKALLIGLVLAHGFVIKGVWNDYAPLLLLDEIAAHLDQRRRAAMFKAILALGTQAWMTGTDEHLFEAIERDAQCYRINQGTIEPVCM